MSDQHSSVPPCWADDPTGRHRYRYWDGTAWTGHVFDGPVPPEGAPGPPPTTAPALPPEPEQPYPYEQALLGDDERMDHTDEAPDAGGRHGPDRSRRAFAIGALVGGLVVAVLAGIAWVTVGKDDDSPTTVATRATTSTSQERTTTTEAPSSTAATSTTLAGRPPAEVRVEVLNASGTAGAAAAKSDSLKGAGYDVVDLGDATAQKGTTVACKSGFEAEAAALAQVVGSGATTQPFPNPPPAGAENVDCVVTLGT